jgi:acyl-CoA reductase-like NAD-dependent aldehyde dehydrogenase
MTPSGTTGRFSACSHAAGGVARGPAYRHDRPSITFESADEVLALSNDSEYGLAAAVWTRDIKKAINTARALRAGIVWINDTQPAPTEAPWGGYKQSGIGRELGSHGLEDYLETKHIYVNLAE